MKTLLGLIDQNIGIIMQLLQGPLGSLAVAIDACIYILLASQRFGMFFTAYRNYITMLQVKQHLLITFEILLVIFFI